MRFRHSGQSALNKLFAHKIDTGGIGHTKEASLRLRKKKKKIKTREQRNAREKKIIAHGIAG